MVTVDSYLRRMTGIPGAKAKQLFARAGASDSTCTAGTGGTRSYGCPITVTVTYDATNKLFLPSNTLMGITFPTNLTATESAMTE